MIKRLVFFASLLLAFHADAFVTRTFAPISSGLESAKPASCVADIELYSASDSGILYRCNHAGTGWVASAVAKQPAAFGAKGDGVTDDTAAMTLWLISIFNGNASGAGACPIGTYRITAPITVFGAPGVAGFLNGAEGYDRGSTGCNIFYDGPPLNGPVLKLVGVNNSIIAHIGINANNTVANLKARAGILITNTSTGVDDLASSGVQLKYVVVNGVQGAGSYGIGIGTTPPVGNAQVSEITLDHPLVQGSGAPGSCIAGIKSFVGGNTKNFTFYNPNLNGCATEIDVTQHGGAVNIYSAQFGNTTVSDVEDHSGGSLNIFGGEAEDYPGSKFINVTSGATGGQVNVEGFRYETSPNLDQVIIVCQATCNFRNFWAYGNSAGHPARVQLNNPVPGNGITDSWTGSGNFFEFAGDQATCDPGGTAPFSSACYTPLYDGSGRLWIDRIRSEKLIGAQIVSENEFGGDFGALTHMQPVNPAYVVTATGLTQFANGLGFDANGSTLVSGSGAPGGPCFNGGLYTDIAGSGLYPCINGFAQEAVTLARNTSPLAFVSSGSTHGLGTSFTIPIAPTAGNTLIAGITLRSAGASGFFTSVALAPSGTACKLDVEFPAPGGTPPPQLKTLYRCPNVPAGTTGIAVTMLGVDSYIAIALEAAGVIVQSNPIDASDASGNQVLQDWSGAAMTPASGKNELIIGFADAWLDAGPLTASAPYTGITENFDASKTAILAYQVVSSTSGSYSPHGTGSHANTTSSIGATYKAATLAGVSNTLPKWASTGGANTANSGFQRYANVKYVRVASTSGLLNGDTVGVAGSLFLTRPVDPSNNGSFGPITVTTCTLTPGGAPPVSPGVSPCYTYPDVNGNTALECTTGCGADGSPMGTTTKGGRTILADSILHEVGAMTGSGVATNTDQLGRITLAGGNGSYTFTGTYTTAPVCFFRDETTPANAVTTQTVSTTAITLVGTGTDVIAYSCHGLN